MTEETKLHIDVPEQGVSIELSDKELSQWVVDEVAFWDSMEKLLSEPPLTLPDGRNISGSYLPQVARQHLGNISTALQKGNTAPLVSYLNDARLYRVLLGHGILGSTVREMIKGERKLEAKWMLLLYSGQWDRDPNVTNTLGWIRAVAIGNPALRGAANINASDAARDRATKAQEESIESAKKLADYIKEKSEALDRLERAYKETLVLKKPAELWTKVSETKHKQWKIWLSAFSALVILPLALIIINHEAAENIVIKITGSGNGVLSGLAALTIPALAYGWLLKNVAKIFAQSLALADDADLRHALAYTFLGLAENKDLTMTEADRALILNALFRPLPTQSHDEGPPHGILELLKGKSSGG
jgi:hypothetical protein